MDIAVAVRSAAVNHKTHMCSCSDCTKIGTIQRRLLLCINIGDLYYITLYKAQFRTKLTIQKYLMTQFQFIQPHDANKNYFETKNYQEKIQFI